MYHGVREKFPAPFFYLFFILVIDALHQSGKVSLAVIGQHDTAHTEIVNGAASKALEVH